MIFGVQLFIILASHQQVIENGSLYLSFLVFRDIQVHWYAQARRMFLKITSKFLLILAISTELHEPTVKTSCIGRQFYAQQCLLIAECERSAFCPSKADAAEKQIRLVLGNARSDSLHAHPGKSMLAHLRAHLWESQLLFLKLVCNKDERNHSNYFSESNKTLTFAPNLMQSTLSFSFQLSPYISY